MPVQIVFKDGTTLEVERCFLVTVLTKKGEKKSWRWQRKSGGKLRRSEPSEIANVQFAPELPESWRPKPLAG